MFEGEACRGVDVFNGIVVKESFVGVCVWVGTCVCVRGWVCMCVWMGGILHGHAVGSHLFEQETKGM